MRQTPTPGSPGSGHCEIRVKGRLDVRWATWFDGLTLDTDADGTTLIHGPIADQAALHGLLQRVRDTGLTLLSVTHVESHQAVARPTDPS